MAQRKKQDEPRLTSLAKCPTGIKGLDEITSGGLPRGRPILVCGGAGCGKTLLGIEFLVRGAMEFHEPGVFMSFEETGEELAKNVASLGYDLTDLVKKKKLALDYVFIERSQIEDTGEYDLEGLFIRLGHAIDSIGAKRVVLDTLEAQFAGLPNELILRSELRRLFRWLKEKGVTAVITGLKPNAEHGFHVHEKGDCSSPDAMSAGGHFNPGGKPHSHFGKAERHAGDLPNLRADAAGSARVMWETDLLTVGSGAANVVGRSVVVHRDPDDYTSQPAGNSGPRIACGVIVTEK